LDGWGGSRGAGEERAKSAAKRAVGCGHWPLPVWRWWRTRRGAGVGVMWCLCLAALNFDRWAGTLTLVEWWAVKVKPTQGGQLDPNPRSGMGGRRVLFRIFCAVPRCLVSAVAIELNSLERRRPALSLAREIWID